MKLYVGDARIITLALYLDNADFEPDSATIKITKGGTTIVDTTNAGASGNQIYYTITFSNVTAAAGEYKFIWVVTKDTEIYTIIDENIEVLAV